MSNITTLKSHIDSVHKGIKYRCELCDYETGDIHLLKYHKKAKHGGIFKCTKCDFTASSDYDLRIHSHTVHKETKLSCDYCEYTATLPNSLKRHVQSVHEGIKYPCNDCEFQASSKVHLNKHKAVKHEGIRFNCAQCHHTSISKAGLKKHIRVVHEGFRYYCDKCDYSAVDKGNLTKHIKHKHENGGDIMLNSHALGLTAQLHQIQQQPLSGIGPSLLYHTFLNNKVKDCVWGETPQYTLPLFFYNGGKLLNPTCVRGRPLKTLLLFMLYFSKGN